MRAPLKFIKYCWTTSKTAQSKCGKGRIWLFIDMLQFGYKYESTTIKYMKLEWYRLNKAERTQIEPQLLEAKENLLYKYKLMEFNSKYASLKYEHPALWVKRNKAYTEMFNMGKGCSIRYHVWLMTTHGVKGELKIGDKVAFGRRTDIDFTGGLTIGNGVQIMEDSRILTHGHNFVFNFQKVPVLPDSERAYLTPLTIADNVMICAGCTIMPGVTSIGENSIISAGSVVTKSVPANSLVAGNPAKVVGSIDGLRMFYYYPKPEHEIPELD